MKFIAGIMMIFSVFGLGCKPNPAEIIAKKWHPVDATGESVTDESKQILLKKGNGMEFLPDGRFVTHSSDDGNDTGTYKLGDNGGTIMVYSSKKKETIFNIEELKSSRLILENHGLVLVLKPGN
jgi:hypothetical protein